MGFEYLQEWRLCNLSGQPVPVFGHTYSEKVFPDVQREPPRFQFVLMASVLSACVIRDCFTPHWLRPRTGMNAFKSQPAARQGKHLTHYEGE